MVVVAGSVATAALAFLAVVLSTTPPEPSGQIQDEAWAFLALGVCYVLTLAGWTYTDAGRLTALGRPFRDSGLTAFGVFGFAILAFPVYLQQRAATLGSHGMSPASYMSLLHPAAKPLHREPKPAAWALVGIMVVVLPLLAVVVISAGLSKQNPSDSNVRSGVITTTTTRPR